MSIVVTNGFLALVGQMDLFVPNVAEKTIGEFLLEACINVVTAVIKFLLQQEPFSIRQGLP